VFDLDGTVFDNGPRTWHILAQFAEANGYGELRRALQGLPSTGLPYLLQDTLARIGITDPAIVDAARAYWASRFFTHDHQSHDVPLAGAVQFVKTVYAAGAYVVYLTGRDVPGMAVGCVRALHHAGLPVALVRTALLLKPDFDTPDLEFKTDIVDFVAHLGVVVASFDNEPGNCNLFAAKWPEALVALVETQHAPGAPALAPSVRRMRDFLA
jgi:hypothetical protein